MGFWLIHKKQETGNRKWEVNMSGEDGLDNIEQDLKKSRDKVRRESNKSFVRYLDRMNQSINEINLI